MQFSISFAAISALLVTGVFASPQRRVSRPNRVSNVNNAPNQQSNSCGNGFTPFCCASDNSQGGTGPNQVSCSVSSNIGGICDGTFVCCNSQNVNVCLGNTFVVINSNNNVF